MDARGGGGGKNSKVTSVFLSDNFGYVLESKYIQQAQNGCYCLLAQFQGSPVNRATVDRLEQAWHKSITSVICLWSFASTRDYFTECTGVPHKV